MSTNAGVAALDGVVAPTMLGFTYARFVMPRNPYIPGSAPKTAGAPAP